MWRGVLEKEEVCSGANDWKISTSRCMKCENVEISKILYNGKLCRSSIYILHPCQSGKEADFF